MVGKDSNLRRLIQQIYQSAPLTAFGTPPYLPNRDCPTGQPQALPSHDA